MQIPHRIYITLFLPSDRFFFIKMDFPATKSSLRPDHTIPGIKLSTRSPAPDMDQHVKRMLKLIDEDADSFTKKVEIYYQKRPELISLVEDLYRMYRSLAERYDHVTGELRKSIPLDLQSQCSGITDLGSEPPSTMPSPGPSRRQSGHRAPGFDFFLGNNGGIGSDVCSKEGDESSPLESESESDDYYSGIQSNDEELGLRRKMLELEGNSESQSPPHRSSGVENFEKLARYEHQLRYSREKIHQSEEEIRRLNFELRKYKSLGETDYQNPMEAQEVQENTSNSSVLTLWEEHRLTREKLRQSEQEVARLRQELSSKGFPLQNLQEQLKLAQKEVSTLQSKLDEEKGEAAKLHEKYRGISEENEKLREEVARLSKERSCLEENVKELELRCLYMEEEVKSTFGFEIEQLKAEIAYKDRDVEELQARHDVLVNEKDDLNINIFELGRELGSKDDQIEEMSSHLKQMQMEQVDLISAADEARQVADELRWKIKELEREVEKKQQIIVQGAEEKREAIRQLCFSLEHYRNGYHRLREVVTGPKVAAS